MQIKFLHSPKLIRLATAIKKLSMEKKTNPACIQRGHMIYICKCGEVINMYKKWDGKGYVPVFYAERSGWLQTEITHCLTCGKELVHSTLQKYYP